MKVKQIRINYSFKITKTKDSKRDRGKGKRVVAKES